MSKCLAILLFLFFTVAPYTVVSSASTSASENVWLSKAPIQQARYGLGVEVVAGKIYAIGGIIDPASWNQAVGTNEEYNPTTDTWSFKEPMPTNRSQFGIAVYQNKVYCIGGSYGTVTFVDGHIDRIETHDVKVNEVYNPATDTWETKASMPNARTSICANVVGNKIYVFGGNSSETIMYDPATDKWMAKAPMPIIPYPVLGRSVSSAVIDDKIHVIGIYLASGQPRPFHQIYDPEHDCWISGAPVPSEGHAFASIAATTGVNAPSRLYVFGVSHLYWGLGLPSSATLVYCPENDSWTIDASIPTQRINVGIAIIDDAIYTIGGGLVGWYNSISASAVNEKYIPVGYFGSIDTKVPNIVVLTPENRTYYTSHVPLSFTMDEAVSRSSYSINAQDPIVITENTTLTELPYGTHNLTVYATDLAGNTAASETINFTIAEETEQFPIAIVVAVVISFVAVVVCLRIYVWKRKH